MFEVTAFERSADCLWLAGSDGHVLEIWEPQEPELVLGRCSVIEEEVNVSALESAPVKVSRRMGGGCAVLIGPGTLLLYYANRRFRPAYPVDWLRHASSIIAVTLERCGIRDLTVEGCGDVTLRNRKILGSCLHISRSGLSYGASLLVRANLALFDQYLLHPPREPEYRCRRPHRDFVSSLSTSGYAHNPSELAHVLGPALWESLHTEFEPKHSKGLCYVKTC